MRSLYLSIVVLFFLGCQDRANSPIAFSEAQKIRMSAPMMAKRHMVMHSIPPRVQISTEKYKHLEPNGFKNTLTSPLSTISIDVDTASYTNIVRKIESQSVIPQKGAVRIEEMLNYFNYSYENPKGDKLFNITTELMDTPWDKKHKLLLVGLKAKEIPKKDLPKSNFVALIDLSGSMGGSISLVKSSLKILVDKLDSNDRLSIIGYANGVGLFLPPTSADKKKKINDVIDSLKTYGGTNGEAGIEVAYEWAKESFIKNGNNRILLFTDGDFNIGKTSSNQIVDIVKKERKNGVYLSVVGFGRGNLNDDLMEQISNHGNGNYSYINDILDANKTFGKEMSGALFTLGNDVKFQLEFNPNIVKSYKLIGYENRKLNDEDFNDDKKDAGEIGVGHRVSVLYELIYDEKELKKVDKLKYQESKVLKNKDEIATIKMRYKPNKSDTSKLITKVVKKDEMMSDNIKFASSVAWFGMALKDEVKNKDYKAIISLAKESKGSDDNGYRAHFIRIVQKASLLDR
jgi:Ca-activated chloride channel family protein